MELLRIVLPEDSEFDNMKVYEFSKLENKGFDDAIYVDEYIEIQIPEARTYVVALRDLIRRCVPEVRERIAWSMPLFEKDKHKMSLAACKRHISLYVDMEIIEILKPQLSEFVIKKNAIYIPYDKEVPIKTIENVIRHSFDTK